MINVEAIEDVLDKMSMQYIKRLIPIRAVQMWEDFEVETEEGVMKGSKGDYLIRGVEGELYPVKQEIFEDTYTLYSEATEKRIRKQLDEDIVNRLLEEEK